MPTKECELSEPGVTVEIADVDGDVGICSKGCFTDTQIFEGRPALEAFSGLQNHRDRIRAYTFLGGNRVLAPITTIDCNIFRQSNAGSLDLMYDFLPIGIQYPGRFDGSTGVLVVDDGKEGKVEVPLGVKSTTDFDGRYAFVKDMSIAKLGFFPTGASCKATFFSGESRQFVEFKIVDTLVSVAYTNPEALTQTPFITELLAYASANCHSQLRSQQFSQLSPKLKTQRFPFTFAFESTINSALRHT